MRKRLAMLLCFVALATQAQVSTSILQLNGKINYPDPFWSLQPSDPAFSNAVVTVAPSGPGGSTSSNNFVGQLNFGQIYPAPDTNGAGAWAALNAINSGNIVGWIQQPTNAFVQTNSWNTLTNTALSFALSAYVLEANYSARWAAQLAGAGFLNNWTGQNTNNFYNTNQGVASLGAISNTLAGVTNALGFGPATNSQLGTAAFTASTAYDAAGVALKATNSGSVLMTNGNGSALTGLTNNLIGATVVGAFACKGITDTAAAGSSLPTNTAALGTIVASPLSASGFIYTTPAQRGYLFVGAQTVNKVNGALSNCTTHFYIPFGATGNTNTTLQWPMMVATSPSDKWVVTNVTGAATILTSTWQGD